MYISITESVDLKFDHEKGYSSLARQDVLYTNVRLIFQYNLDTHEWEAVQQSGFNFAHAEFRKIKNDGTGFKNTTRSGFYPNDSFIKSQINKHRPTSRITVEVTP